MTHPRSILINHPRRTHPSLRAPAGFTLTELIVAVVILIIVILATSKIFGTASKVTGQGQALASILQEANAIERQMRDDISRLSYEGFFAIHSVAVFNNINGAVLLNANLPPDAVIHADQLMFFANGIDSVQTFRNGTGSAHFGQGTISRIYYGPAYQIPNGPGVISAGGQNVQAYDFLSSANGFVMTPWYSGNATLSKVYYNSSVNDTPADYVAQGTFGPVSAIQPPATQWLLARQPVILADDDTTAAAAVNKHVFLASGSISSRSTNFCYDNCIQAGRVDAAAQELNEIRSLITILGGTTPRNWLGIVAGQPDQYTWIKNFIFYPRAERTAPSMHRVDQALTNAVLATACSSFTIDWTYNAGVGFVDPDNTPATNNSIAGCAFNSALEHPWFGLSDFAINSSSSPPRGVGFFGEAGYQTAVGYTPAAAISPVGATYPANFLNSIESNFSSYSGYVQEYWACFGYNRNNPPLTNNSVDPTLAATRGYTPWPSAIRVTMTLHDPDNRIESGRDFQFVIDLPRPPQ